MSNLTSKLSLLLLFILFLLNNPILAQTEEDSLHPIKKNSHEIFVSTLLDDTYDFCVAPLDWGTKEYVYLGATGLGVYLTYHFFDNRIKNFSERNKSKFSEKMSSAAEKIGRSQYPLAVLVGTYLGANFFEDDQLRLASFVATEAILISGALCLVTKLAVGRARPFKLEGKSSFVGPTTFASSYKSFFSGHTTTAFALASSFAEIYSNKSWVSYLSYSLATITGISRIHDGKHWASDVFLGAVVGTVTGRFIAQKHKNALGNLDIIPFFSDMGTAGVGLSIKF